MATSITKYKKPVIMQQPRQLRKDSKIAPILGQELQYSYAPPNMEDYIKTYETSVWAYASVYVIATSAASVALKMYGRLTLRAIGRRLEVAGKTSEPRSLLRSPG